MMDRRDFLGAASILPMAKPGLRISMPTYITIWYADLVANEEGGFDRPVVSTTEGPHEADVADARIRDIATNGLAVERHYVAPSQVIRLESRRYA